MKETRGLKPSNESLTASVSTKSVKTQKLRQQVKPGKRFMSRETILVLLPLGAFLLWLISLQWIDVRAMSDLGLVSVMPPATMVALGLMSLSFCLTLQEPRLRKPLLLLHMALFIFMLYGITALIENEPRFSTVYTHIGYTEYIMRHGSVAPSLDTYFSWPTFFILGAFFTKVAGFSSAMSFVAWAPVFLNLIYFGPLYLILQSLTTKQRVVWLGIWLFYLANWIGQDYYSPQGMNIFLYLIIVAILLKWFKTSPQKHCGQQSQEEQSSNWWKRTRKKLRNWLAVSDTAISPTTPWQRVGLLLILFGVFAFDVSSHPLTPFFVLAAVIALVIFRRISLFWLPVPMVIMTAWWIFVMGRDFLAGHTSLVIGSFGLLGSSIALNVTSHVVGSPGHVFITKMDEVMTAMVWGLAFLGGLRRLLSGYRDLTLILLAIAPFPLLVAQDYGGEMLLRIYLVSLPFMVFFIASLFYEPEPRLSTQLTSFVARLFDKRSPSLSARWITAILMILLMVMQGLFLFARYGDERNNYVSTSEVNAISYLYRIAPHNSILMRSWEGGPWHFQDYEYYDYYSLDDGALTVDIATNNYNALAQYVKQQHPPAAYIVFMRSTQVSFAATSGLPSGRLMLIEHELLASGKCKLIFENQDTQILKFV